MNSKIQFNKSNTIIGLYMPLLSFVIFFLFFAEFKIQN